MMAMENPAKVSVFIQLLFFHLPAVVRNCQERTYHWEGHWMFCILIYYLYYIMLYYILLYCFLARRTMTIWGRCLITGKTHHHPSPWYLKCCLFNTSVNASIQILMIWPFDALVCNEPVEQKAREFCQILNIVWSAFISKTSVHPQIPCVDMANVCGEIAHIYICWGWMTVSASKSQLITKGSLWKRFSMPPDWSCFYTNLFTHTSFTCYRYKWMSTEYR